MLKFKILLEKLEESIETNDLLIEKVATLNKRIDYLENLVTQIGLNSNYKINQNIEEIMEKNKRWRK